MSYEREKERDEEIKELLDFMSTLNKMYKESLLDKALKVNKIIELTEMIEALVSELEGNFKTDHTFRLIEEANKLTKQT